MLKEGDLVKIVGKFDNYPWNCMVWELGDFAYVDYVQGSYVFLRRDPYKKSFYKGIFKIATDLIKIEQGGQLPLPFKFKGD